MGGCGGLQGWQPAAQRVDPLPCVGIPTHRGLAPPLPHPREWARPKRLCVSIRTGPAGASSWGGEEEACVAELRSAGDTCRGTTLLVQEDPGSNPTCWTFVEDLNASLPSLKDTRPSTTIRGRDSQFKVTGARLLGLCGSSGPPLALRSIYPVPAQDPEAPGLFQRCRPHLPLFSFLLPASSILVASHGVAQLPQP